MVVYRTSVQLADGEWSNQQNGQKMLNVAREYAEQYEDKRPLIVTVYEHAGWWLSYLFSEKHDGLVVGTANDAAILSPEAYEFSETYCNAKTEYLGGVRR